MAETKPVPILRGEEKIYFAEAKAGRLVFQECAGCGHRLFYPRVACTNCRSDDLRIVASSGRGTIYSYTTLHMPGHPAFANDVPYTIVLVTLEEGVRVLADLVECRPENVAVGLPVEVLFDVVTPDFTVPRFRPSQVGGGGQ